jgi:23S rRNA pseudouridine1911/1915/1917 synthase
LNRKPHEINGRYHLIIPVDAAPDRADRALAELLSGVMTRSSLSRLIRDGLVTSEAKRIRPSTLVKPGQEVTIEFNSIIEKAATIPCAIPHPVILFEDDHVMVLNKPAGLVVHPGAGTREPTLMDILVESRPSMIGVGEHDRWGIVHRLDKDTSGVMIVAKTILAHEDLSAQFKVHSVGRIYLALVRGTPKSQAGVIDKELGRSQSDRKKMSPVTRKGRLAVTSWRVKEGFGRVSLLEIRPETGRTHQIRVHLASVGLPILGDRVYGMRANNKPHSDQLLNKLGSILKRQALHAAFLSFKHPATGETLDFSSDAPSDMSEAIRICREVTLEHG